MARAGAIDWGQVRIGLALSDESGFLASPLPAIKRSGSLESIALFLSTFFAEKNAKKVFIGWPLHLNGKEGVFCPEIRLFCAAWSLVSSIPIVTYDERLTTAQAERTLREQGMSRKKRTGHIDSASAVVLLQGILDGGNG